VLNGYAPPKVCLTFDGAYFYESKSILIIPKSSEKIFGKY
jgi:hypothetical protein